MTSATSPLSPTHTWTLFKMSTTSNSKQDKIRSEYSSVNSSKDLQSIQSSIFNNETINQESVTKYTEQYKTFFENLKKAAETSPEKASNYASLLSDSNCPKSLFPLVKEFLLKHINGNDEDNYKYMMSLGI